MDLDVVNEEWFAGKLATDSVDAVELLIVLMELCTAERTEEARGWAQQLFDKLAEARDYDQALQVLEWQAVTLNAVPDLPKTLKKLFTGDRKSKKLIEPCGFGDSVPVAECFKRLNSQGWNICTNKSSLMYSCNPRLSLLLRPRYNDSFNFPWHRLFREFCLPLGQVVAQPASPPWLHLL